MKIIALKSAVAAALCTASLSIAESSADEDPETNPWRVIEAGAYSNIEEASQQVIQSEEAWSEWWNRHNTTIEIIDGKHATPKAPAVDFAEETVIIATMGTRSTGGYSIEFTNIRHDDEDVVATLKTTSPAPDDIVTMALTAPYAIIAIPKHEGPVRFEFEE